jgi:hypothetical protein
LNPCYYTTNGTTPTTNSSVYTGPITVSSTEILSVILVASGYAASRPSAAIHTINMPVAAPPTFSPAGHLHLAADGIDQRRLQCENLLHSQRIDTGYQRIAVYRSNQRLVHEDAEHHRRGQRPITQCARLGPIHHHTGQPAKESDQACNGAGSHHNDSLPIELVALINRV